MPGRVGCRNHWLRRRVPAPFVQWAGGKVHLAADPFTALCVADEWYKANVEEPANVTKETP